jgi:putative hydrolase of the HAD superfamily
MAGAQRDRAGPADLGWMQHHHLLITVDEHRGRRGPAAAGAHARRTHALTVTLGHPHVGDGQRRDQGRRAPSAVLVSTGAGGAGRTLPGVIIGLDGDDTLWHSEREFAGTQARYRDLLAKWADHDTVERRLLDVERRNLEVFGYGVKGFTLSMVETAIDLSGGEIPASEIHAIVGLGKELLGHPVELIDGVDETVTELAQLHKLLLITKGDLLHQETKLAASGLGERFWRIEIVSEKDVATYRRILERHEIEPADFVMVGNSVRSDILPVLDLGARAVHVPYHITWEMEHVAIDDEDLFPTISTLRDLVDLVASWS